MRRTSTTLATLALLGAVGALGACGSEDSAPTTGADTSEGPASDEQTTGGAADELAAADGQPCPATLPEPDGGAPVGPAAGSPDLVPAETAWVCEYASGDGWQLQGEPVEVDPTAVPALDLAPAPTDLMCTEELGPRWLLVTDNGGGDLTGVLVDDFGCDHVRVTADPDATPAGEADEGGAVSGVLTGPEGLASDLAALHAG